MTGQEAAGPLLLALSVVFVPLALAWWLIARGSAGRRAREARLSPRCGAARAGPCGGGGLCSAPFCPEAGREATHCRRCPLREGPAVAD